MRRSDWSVIGVSTYPGRGVDGDRLVALNSAAGAGETDQRVLGRHVGRDVGRACGRRSWRCSRSAPIAGRACRAESLQAEEGAGRVDPKILSQSSSLSSQAAPIPRCRRCTPGCRPPRSALRPPSAGGRSPRRPKRHREPPRRSRRSRGSPPPRPRSRRRCAPRRPRGRRPREQAGGGGADTAPSSGDHRHPAVEIDLYRRARGHRLAARLQEVANLASKRTSSGTSAGAASGGGSGLRKALTALTRRKTQKARIRKSRVAWIRLP